MFYDNGLGGSTDMTRQELWQVLMPLEERPAYEAKIADSLGQMLDLGLITDDQQEVLGAMDPAQLLGLVEVRQRSGMALARMDWAKEESNTLRPADEWQELAMGQVSLGGAPAVFFEADPRVVGQLPQGVTNFLGPDAMSFCTRLTHYGVSFANLNPLGATDFAGLMTEFLQGQLEA